MSDYPKANFAKYGPAVRGAADQVQAHAAVYPLPAQDVPAGYPLAERDLPPGDLQAGQAEALGQQFRAGGEPVTEADLARPPVARVAGHPRAAIGQAEADRRAHKAASLSSRAIRNGQSHGLPRYA
jgi:hypothetical protein